MLLLGAENSLRWKANKSGIFKVKSVFNWCESLWGLDFALPPLIWNKHAPPKAQFFTWLVGKGKLKTSIWLQRLGVLYDGVDVTCAFCKSEP